VNATSDSAPTDNPFSARHIRPGAIPYRFPPGQDVDMLVHRLEANQWRAQIVGPHGSGKSTLLASLLPAVQRAGKPALLVTLHDGQRALPAALADGEEFAAKPLVAVDGYEQLSRWSRIRLDRLCRRHDLGLLVTTHHPVRLPELARTATDPQLAQSLVAELLGGRGDLIAPEEIAERFTAHQGNLRELLFDLYDLYEQRRGG
jgi:hypothetical protein